MRTFSESENKVDPSIVALHEYDPLSDCCTGLNCSWLEAALEVIVTRGLFSTTGVLPSGGPFSH